MKTQNIINEFWDYIEARKNNKLEGRIHNWLNKDNLGSITVNDNVFWLEKTCSFSTIPNYCSGYIVKWGKAKGLIYLYDLV